MFKKEWIRSVFNFALLSIPISFLIVASDLFFPYITGKHFLFRTLVLIALSSYSILMVHDKKIRPVNSKITFAYTFYVFTLIVSTVFAQNPSVSFWSNYERMDGLLNVLFVLGYFFMLASYIRIEGILKVIGIFLSVSTFVALAGIWQFITEDTNRLNVIFGNAIYLAIFMVFHVAFALLYGYRTKNWVVKYVLYGTIPLAIFTMIQTSTRGASLGFAIGFLSAVIYYSFVNFKKGNHTKYALTTIAITIFIVLSILVLRNSDFVQSSASLKRITHISVAEGSVSSRFNVWKIAVKSIEERPILGWGIEGFNYGFNKYYIPEMYRFEPWFDRAHNMVLDILIWGGIFSFLAYIILWILFILTVHKTDRLTVYEKSILLGVTIAYAFHSMTVFDNLGSYLAVAIILAWTSNFSDKFETVFDIPHFSYASKIKKYITYATPLLILIIFTYTVYMPYVGNRYLLNGLRLSGYAYGVKSKQASKDILNKALNELGLAFEYAPMYGTEITGQMVNASKYFIATKDQNVISKYFKLTESIALFVLNKDPYNMRVRLSLANLYSIFGFFEEAEKQIDFMLKYSPDRQLFILTKANIKLAKGDKKTALDLLNRAYNLDTSQKNILRKIEELKKTD